MQIVPRVIVLSLIFSFTCSSWVRSEDGLALSRSTLAARVDEIERANDLSHYTNAGTWALDQATLRLQLIEMLGLPPLEGRDPDLKVQVTGTLEDDQVIVEKIVFQSLPGLYVTGNLYRPKSPPAAKRLPAILYVCGHGQVKQDGISLGNKTYYQQHGAWFAQHGYLCLAIDTIQLGEIEGIHHGLYRYDRWDWPARGYTPAGVEAWNALRAIDYLISRPDVDPEKLGITGRSGGGAYSWYTAAIDPRIATVVPVAGITDLRDHIIGECVRGHCDCMYMVNRYGWDYSTLAAMIHPRALLIGNTDEDPIFPLDGVVRVHSQVRHPYRLQSKDHLGIQWTTGGHDDTPELQLGCFVWFDRFLHGERRTITQPAEPRFERAQLRVLDAIPKDQRVTDVQDWFVPEANPIDPANSTQWDDIQRSIQREVAGSVHGRVPLGKLSDVRPPQPFKPSFVFEASVLGRNLTCYDIEVPPGSKCRIVRCRRNLPAPNKTIRIIPANQAQWPLVESFFRMSHGREDAKQLRDWEEQVGLADDERECVWVFPEGRGPWAWPGDGPDKAGLHLRRSYLLCGWSLEGRQIAGILKAMEYLLDQAPDVRFELESQSETEMLTLHAALLSPIPLEHVQLGVLPASYRDGFVLTGILRSWDVPHVLAAVATRFPVSIDANSKTDLRFVRDVESILGRALLQTTDNPTRSPRKSP
jgi:dienelactone hydrolase